MSSDKASWHKRLLKTENGGVRPIVANAIIALRHSLEWRGILEFDEFHQCVMLADPPPWKRGAVGWKPTKWSDADDIRAANWMQQVGINVSSKVVAEAVEVVARDGIRHPIREYLDGLKWDGEQRVESFLTNYLGVEDNEYTRGVSRCLLVSAVARIMQPGCKADYMVVLEGPQGAFKSTALSTMFGPWFSDDIANLGSKDAAMQVGNAWCIEVAELGAMLKTELEKVKAFISRRTDIFRPPYGRRVIDQHRQCIFVGTTNRDVYLQDETGGRRFWPVAVGDIDIEAIQRDKDQIWAEATAMYHGKVPWWPDRVMLELAREEQDCRYADDALQPQIEHWLRDKDDTSINEIMSTLLGLELHQRNNVYQHRIAAVLKRLGWGRYRASAGRREWRYARGLGQRRTSKYGKS